ncbi:MAG: VOC family protein [Alphaproteobacteria bacterium]|nr:VOC family protein [Alphaproteobacteria bacterium]
MFDHVSIGVADLARARKFYDRALAPLGLKPLMIFEASIGYGRDRPFFWVGLSKDASRPEAGLHIAFAGSDRAQVHAFHAAALSAGGRDDGPPGLRPQYTPDYYAAFVTDPDGHRIEAVCRKPGGAP